MFGLRAVPAGVQRASDSWSIYYNFDQYLVGGDDGRGFGIFGRAGWADDSTNLIHQFYSGGIGGKGILPGRENDTFGAGYYYLRYSDNLPGFAALDDHEQGWEIFYDVALTPWFSVAADVQFVESAIDQLDDAVIGGLRGRIRF